MLILWSQFIIWNDLLVAGAAVVVIFIIIIIYGLFRSDSVVVNKMIVEWWHGGETALT
jgi:hypothetical protein